MTFDMAEIAITRWALALVVAAVLAACTGSDAATPESSAPPSSELSSLADEIDGVRVESRRHVGPRATDDDREMTLIVDSIQFSGDDIFVLVRVENSGDDALAVGADDTFYGPLLQLLDDRGNAYPARAVEPAGVYAHSVGRFGLRLAGPVDPQATEFTVELASDRGPLTTEPFAAPEGDALTWWTESPPEPFIEPPFADLPALPDLLHAQISNESLTSTSTSPS